MAWLERAAAQGFARALHALGLLHSLGGDIPQNWREAYIHFSLAAAGGVNEAAVLRDTAAKQLSPADLAAAQQESARRHAEIY